MKRIVWSLAFIFMGTAASAKAGEVNDRVVRAAVVLKEITQTRDRNIPQDLLDRSACVAVIPGMKKGGFIFGANYGKGLISCRTDHGEGPWSAPSMFLLQGGSFGMQIGGQSIDLILVIMNMSGMESMLDTKITLGGDVSVAAGPIGRTASAETDALLSAEILAYSRTRGLFAGLVIKGGVIRPDKDANHVLYGKPVGPKDLLFKPPQSVPKDVEIFLNELNRVSPKRVRR